MKYFFIALLTLAAIQANAQPETIKTSEGDIIITPILHSTTAIQWAGRTLYYDPYGGAERFADLPAPGLVLITDIHGDHLNKETLQGLDLSEAHLIAPQAVADELDGVSFKNIQVLANGEQTTWNGITIEALPMYNLPETEDSRHPKGRGNGYLLTIAGKRLYLSGDTEDIPEMRQRRDIDAAFVCMNLPYTMSIEQAADAVLEFQPKVVYPFHYRGKEGFSDVAAFKAMVEKGNPDIEVRLLDWYPEGD
ncbi:MAG: MBL fold metallo-hydrolase [Lewinellaceae bacterium]|nr:MBL fold metallo-hydrolase [Lewinellaceae bacterium]